MNRNDIFLLVAEMIAFHRDLQHLPTAQDIQPFLFHFFEVPEKGVFYNIGEYEINPNGVYIKPWTNKKAYRFSWKTILLEAAEIRKQESFF